MYNIPRKLRVVAPHSHIVKVICSDKNCLLSAPINGLVCEKLVFGELFVYSGTKNLTIIHFPGLLNLLDRTPVMIDISYSRYL